MTDFLLSALKKTQVRFPLFSLARVITFQTDKIMKTPKAKSKPVVQLRDKIVPRSLIEANEAYITTFPDLQGGKNRHVQAVVDIFKQIEFQRPFSLDDVLILAKGRGEIPLDVVCDLFKDYTKTLCSWGFLQRIPPLVYDNESYYLVHL